MQVFVQFRVLAGFTCFCVSERINSLCFQVREIPFVFLSIKSRMFSRVWKAGRTSGAGRTCTINTVTGPGLTDNISILKT